MNSVSEKKDKFTNSFLAQMIIIIATFAIMGVSSFFFVRRIERDHLIRDAETALTNTEAEIVADLMEPETFLNGHSETIRAMILRNEGENAVTANLRAITNFLQRNNDMKGLLGTHGYFHTWGGKYISGRNWMPPEGWDVTRSQWYNTAVQARGKIAMSDPYKDVITGDTVLTISRFLMNDDGSPLGVICLDIEISRIEKFATNINLTDSSYGLLLDKSLEILAHPDPFLIGELIYNIDSGTAELYDELSQGRNIYERKIKNYMQEDAVVFFQNMKYGWHLGIIIPVGEYYNNLNNIAVFLILLGSVLAALLILMLYNISLAKRKSDLRTQQKSNFLATMSHEIRTPLNAILGITEIQILNSTHPPSTSEAFIKINNSGNLLLGIINDILDLSKIESGKLELAPVKYEVASLINDIVQLNHVRYESKPIEFILDIDENIPSILVGDELRIKQILNNLLSNAFKYTEQGEVILTVGAECVGRGGAVLVTLVFQVSDTGQGMTTDQMSKLFDEYTRFNMEANRTTEGAGLGMTITRNLVDLMYGKIGVKSAIGEGTTVTVRLPQKTDGVGIRGIIGKEVVENLRQFQLGNVTQIKRTQITHEPMPYGSVLIVDDVETNLYVAKGLMAPYGIKIDLATNGFEAIDKVKEGTVYDIIFMDHMMPKMDGIETVKRIRAMEYKYPIVALTANALAGHAEMFLSSGFDDFISKPIDMRQLNIVLLKFIRDKQSQDVIEAAHREKAENEKKFGASSANQPVDTQLAEIFARDAEKALAVLQGIMKSNFQKDNDKQMYIINVHAMKSALANIGEREISAIALRLEQAGREDDLNVILSETPKFLEELMAVIEKIKPKDEEEESEDTEESLEFLREKLIIVRDACEAFDKKAAKTALNELREKTWSHKIKELINTIAEHLLHSEFDDAAALTDGYVKE